MNSKKIDERLRARMRRAADEYFAGLGEHPLTEAQIMDYIDRKGEIVMKKKVSTFAVVFAMVFLLGSVALAAGLGVFGSFTGREDGELSALRLEKLDAVSVSLGLTEDFVTPGEKKDEAGLTDAEKALNRLAGRECELTLDQVYCDGHRLYYSYTLKLDALLDTVFGEGEPTGDIEWTLEYPGEYAETRYGGHESYAETTKWLTEHDAAFVAKDSLALGDGAWMDGEPLMIFDSAEQWLDDTTIQGYQEVRLPEGFKAGESIDIELSVSYGTRFVYQDAEGMKEASVSDPQNRGFLRVPMTVPVTGKTSPLSGRLETDAYTVSAELTVSEVDIFGKVTFTGVEGWLANGGASGDPAFDTTPDFIKDYLLVAGGETLRNVEGGLSDIVDGSYTIGLRFDLPGSLESLALRPVKAQDDAQDIPLK